MAVHILAHIDALLGQANRSLMGGIPLHVGISHLGVGLFDVDSDLGLRGGVASGVYGYISEGIAPCLVLIGGIHELAGAVLCQSHSAPGGGGGELEGQGVPLAVHGVEISGDGHVFIGGQLHIPSDWGLIFLVQKVQGDGNGPAVLRGGEAGGEGKGGGGHGGDGRALEPEPVQSGTVYHSAYLEGLAADD